MEKLAKLQARSKAGSKGTPRYKTAAKPKNAVADDSKLQAALKKLPVQPITGIEECNMFLDNGKVLHFDAPKVHAQTQGNTVAVYGAAEQKNMTDIPNVFNQLGNDQIGQMRKLMEQFQAGGGPNLAGLAGRGGIPPALAAAAAAAQARAAGGAGAHDEDDVPDLVEGDEASKIEALD